MPRIASRIALVAAIAAGSAGHGEAQSIRGHGPSRGGSHGGAHFHHGHHYYAPYYWGFGYRYPYYYAPYYAPYYYPYYPYPGYAAAPYYSDPGPAANVAYLDTDVSPEKAQVYLDGEHVGEADQFDGYPRFLAVQPGRHTVTFQAKDRQTVTRRVNVPAGAVLSFDFTLPKGDPKQVDDSGDEIVIPGAPSENGGSDRYRPGNENEGEVDQEGEPPGSLRLRVMPPDASVYIDGEFFGTASTISRLHGNLRLDPGRHLVEVARPGYRTVKRNVEIRPGERASLEIDLERD